MTNCDDTARALMARAVEDFPLPPAPVARVLAAGRRRQRRAAAGSAVLAVASVAVIAGAAAGAASLVRGDDPPRRPDGVVFAAPASPDGSTIPGSAAGMMLKPPAPGTNFTVISEVPAPDGTDRPLAYWRAAEGWDCLGWPGGESGLTNLCSNDETDVDPDALSFAGGTVRRPELPQPVGQAIAGFAPAIATTVVVRAGGRAYRTRTYAGVPAGRGATAFALIAPADLGDSTVEALDADGRVLARRGRPAQDRS